MLAVLVFSLLVGQGRADAPKPPIETAHLLMAVSATPESAAAGKKVTLALDVTPKPKMHVYSPGQDGYIAITLSLEPNPAITARPGSARQQRSPNTAAMAKYPAGEKFFMPALNETQLVYAKPFRITQDVTLKSATGEALTIKGSVRYQACDDRICYLPVTVPVEWKIAMHNP